MSPPSTNSFTHRLVAAVQSVPIGTRLTKLDVIKLSDIDIEAEKTSVDSLGAVITSLRYADMDLSSYSDDDLLAEVRRRFGGGGPRR